MSAGDNSVVCLPLCQGFLKKRKDKLRLRWVTYWFKLHNGILFFYTRKHGTISDLRGQYYLIEVESVRELMWTKKKHYIFEIAMKNGKRKVLAAETADLRKLWMCQLSQAMSLHVYDSAEPSSNRERTPGKLCRTQSSSCSMICSSNLQPVDTRRHSADSDSLGSPSMPSAAVIPTSTTYIYVNHGTNHENIPQDGAPSHIVRDVSQVQCGQCAGDEVEQKGEVFDLENDYDVLPLCKPLHSEEVIYDTPPSNRRISEKDEETSENIYDIPTFAFTQNSVNDSSPDKEVPEMSGLLYDMVMCLGGNSAEWAQATAPEAVCQP